MQGMMVEIPRYRMRVKDEKHVITGKAVVVEFFTSGALCIAVADLESDTGTKEVWKTGDFRVLEYRQIHAIPTPDEPPSPISRLFQAKGPIG